MIIQALDAQLKEVSRITQVTIEEIYRKYYPTGAVEFFKNHHNDENIRADIYAGFVYLLAVEGKNIGTVTIKKNEICRLFVLPDFQHKGFGKMLLDFAEDSISKKYSTVVLDASLPAKRIYQLRDYQEIEYHQITTDNGDVLCYDIMKKELTKNMTTINYSGKNSFQ